MKLSLLQKVGIFLGSILCIAILVEVLTTQPISKTNTTSFKGHFSYIEKIITRGCTSYDLHIQEKQDFYKISADWSDCFAYNNFQYEIKVGQPIEIITKKDNSLLSLRKPFVVSILANGRDYLSSSCINQKINDEKITVPLIFGLLALVLFTVVIIKKDKKFKRQAPFR